MNNLFKWLGLGVLVLSVFFLVQFGLSAGLKNQQARVVIQNAQAIKQGLEFFYADFDRLPKETEFFSPALMQPYFSNFPPPNFSSADCPETFLYKRFSVESAEINFCLPTEALAFSAGWNKLSIGKPR